MAISNDPAHRAGQTLDQNDQTSSVALLGIAVVGACVADLLLWLVI